MHRSTLRFNSFVFIHSCFYLFFLEGVNLQKHKFPFHFCLIDSVNSDFFDCIFDWSPFYQRVCRFKLKQPKRFSEAKVKFIQKLLFTLKINQFLPSYHFKPKIYITHYELHYNCCNFDLIIIFHSPDVQRE